MINFSGMNVGDEVALPAGEWDDGLRAIFEQAKEFMRLEHPDWQFEADRVHIGNKSTNPPTKDQYVIRRIR